MNPWTVLGLEQNEDDPVAIRTAYKRWVQVYHPDRFASATDNELTMDEWTERFKEIQLAYEILIDSDKLAAWINGDDPRSRSNRIEAEVEDMLRQVVGAVAAMSERINLADEIRARLRIVEDRITDAIKNNRSVMEMRERILARLGGEKDDLLHQMVEKQLETSRRALLDAEISLEAVKIAREKAQAFSDPGYVSGMVQTSPTLYFPEGIHRISFTNVRG